MVRGRVELRRIEERGRRQVSFAKRRKGLLKKAAELGVLCDAHVAVLVFSPFDGAVHHFAAPSTVENIIERYQNFSSAHKKVDDKCLPEQSNSKVSRGTRNGRPNFADMSIDESSISELTVEQLGQIEMKLKDALRSTMARKTQLMSDTIGKLQEKGKSLTDERSLMDVTLLQDKDNIERGETGSKPSSGRMDGMLRLSIGANSNGNISLHHGLGDKHTGKGKLTIDLNIS